MIIIILFPGSVSAHSAELLTRSLAAAGWRVETRRGPDESGLRALDLLIQIESFSPGGRRRTLPAEADGGRRGAGANQEAITIDLCACDGIGSPSSLGLICNGHSGFSGLVSAVLSGGPIDIAIVRHAGGDCRAAIWARGVTVASQPSKLAVTLDEVCLRIADLIDIALRRLERGEASLGHAGPASPGGEGFCRYASFAAGALAGRIARRLDQIVRYPEHWTVRLRASAQPDLVTSRLAWPEGRYETLADDGARYYADPFLFERGGRCYLFVEEFPYATGKGILSVSEIGPGGAPDVPRPIIEGPSHLSYPQVFEHGGQVWMIPETSGARTIELYRAVDFPHRWVREGILIGEIDAPDATLAVHEGRFWIFAALHAGHSSPRDMLGIFHADALAGPWQAHAANPVLVDAAAARPGGAFFQRGGALMRVAQDCTRIYGGGITLARVDRLDPEHFQQEVVARLGPRPDWKSSGVHTLNAAGGFEVIDTVASKCKLQLTA